ncbi:presenilin-associated rhomboid-like protein, mitochondrial [Oscarella lobularis]|uniref:presenilin-associated rhomboid-like protein, mitochondrial n=1 Tax=Oscarella lobularis TaxID=121494 RepID=UPI0033137275
MLAKRVYSIRSLRFFLSRLRQPPTIVRRLDSRWNSADIPSPPFPYWKPLGFTIMTGCAAFGIAKILEYERLKRKSSSFSNLHHEPKYGRIRQKLNTWWASLSGVRKVTVGIIAMNSLVLLMWRVPSLNRIMTRWFTSSIASRSSTPLLLSCFSHADVWHFALNMYVLWSFSAAFQNWMSPEEYLATYVTGGVFSSCFSVMLRAARAVATPSLGASGAILNLLAMTCIAMPDARLAIVFLPFISFSAGMALMGIVTLDVAGLLLSWRLFDHAAHLGGVAFGAWYLSYGKNVLWKTYAEKVNAAWKRLTK